MAQHIRDLHDLDEVEPDSVQTVREAIVIGDPLDPQGVLKLQKVGSTYFLPIDLDGLKGVVSALETVISQNEKILMLLESIAE